MTVVSKASTVMALRRITPLRAGKLTRNALDVGHDHIAATVNTLVLAYAGASLPVLLVFLIGGTSFGDAVNTEAVAAQDVANDRGLDQLWIAASTPGLSRARRSSHSSVCGGTAARLRAV